MSETPITIEDLDRLTAAVLVVAQCVNRLAEQKGVKDEMPGVLVDLEPMLGDVRRFRLRQ